MTTSTHGPQPAAVPRPAARLASIAPLQASHLAEVTAIYLASLAEGLATFEDPQPDQAEITRRIALAQDAGLPALVALDGRGRVLGFAWASLFRARAAYRATVEDSIYLAAEARGAGIGQKLLRRLIAQCEAVGCRQMISVVGDSRNLASIRLHEQLGFVAAGYLAGAGWRPEGPVDVVMLQRPLSGTPMPGLA